MQRKQLWLASGLIVTAALWRVINWHYGLAPNLEIVTASSLLAAVWIGWRGAVAVPLLAMAVSDVVIGNSPILFFTWTAFALIGGGGLLLRRWQGRPAGLMLASLGGGIAASLFFFIYTNFGVWLIGNSYPHTWAGLMQCYAMGLPFYRTMLVGNLIFVPAYFGAALYLGHYASQRLEAAGASSRQ
jgi:hypothetical protein